MPVVEMESASFDYAARPVVRQVDLQVNAGEHLALRGANGSGKSTLLGLVAGILAPSGGRVITHGVEVSLVVQRSAVADTLPLTVRQAVGMGRWRRTGWLRRPSSRDRAMVDSKLERLGIADLAHRQLGELSGGQRQRVLLAQGLAQDAGILLLDEPTAGVDQVTHEAIRALVREEAARGVAVIEATHSAEDASQADRIVFMHDGRLHPDPLP